MTEKIPPQPIMYEWIETDSGSQRLAMTKAYSEWKAKYGKKNE